ncbi:hypothetical protein T11_8865 [Trichinella zimbabwensis]|uniref:Uncharacterized protein n=1 Tax=Trichinella zimbabwensis TaxID=268475 RepID=A0A0V1HU02_9BILA|nr:hypothetical protein T11_8865 [Trichinella zimbabwensis]
MYSKKLKEYMTEGIMERVENVNDYEGRTWYLPHHMVGYCSIVKLVTCRKGIAKDFLPKMSDLPRERVVEVSLFENFGLDLAGPLYARE